MEELAGRTAVVTGAGSGMGKAFALRFVAKIRRGGLYLLTDHEWDDQVIRRHEEIIASAVGPESPKGDGK